MASRRAQFWIGKLVVVRLPFYNAKDDKVQFKARPALVIGVEKDELPCDMNYIPLSRVSHHEYVDPVYDIKINEEQCKRLSLKYSPSYIRTHKQGTISSYDISHRYISDLKQIDRELYDRVKKVHEMYQHTLF
ncbi:MAG: hypothetical protein Q4A55_06550 [Aerococcus sp.]|nr:hypothetical protein [Aerococcus sp.]